MQRRAFSTSQAFLGVTFALLAAVGFSAKAILVKLAYYDSVDAITLLALRMVFSLPFFAAMALWTRRRKTEPINPKDVLVILALGLSGYYISSFLDFLGLQYISAGLERLILFLYPTMTVVLSALVQRQAIGKRVLGAIGLSYSGIVLVFLHDLHSKQDAILLGTSLVFASTITYSVYLVSAGHAIARIGAARFTAYGMLVASAACILQFLFTHPLKTLDLPLRVYELSLGMAVFSTVLPAFFLSYAIRNIGSGHASLIGSVGPVSTIYLAYIFLGEEISMLQIAGSALVLAGVVIVSVGKGKG